MNRKSKTGAEDTLPRTRAPGAVPGGRLDAPELLEMHFFMRLAREWDLRFEKLFRQGAVSKWYSSVGNEATTVAAATAIEAGDALCTLHRDSGAILRYYLDARQIAPTLPPGSGRRRPPRSEPAEVLHKLACQMLGKAEGFTGGFDRSYHYALIDEASGLVHVGMISHLGAMVPVAAGLALAFKQRGSDRVALNFIGDGGTSTGDFHEALNMAAVLRVPLVLVIENNRYAFSTPTSQQFATAGLAGRGAGYGVPGVQVDGNDPEAVWREVSRAVARARSGDGPTLIEAVLGRLRGHSEGDDSLEYVPAGERESFARSDPLDLFERKLLERKFISESVLQEINARCATLVLETVDRALATPEPDPSTGRDIHAS